MEEKKKRAPRRSKEERAEEVDAIIAKEKERLIVIQEKVRRCEEHIATLEKKKSSILTSSEKPRKARSLGKTGVIKKVLASGMSLEELKERLGVE